MKKIISAAIIGCAFLGMAACGEPKPATETPIDSTTTTTPADTSTMQPATPDTSNNR